MTKHLRELLDASEARATTLEIKLSTALTEVCGPDHAETLTDTIRRLAETAAESAVLRDRMSR